MSETPKFTLWLEFEQWEKPHDSVLEEDPNDDFANVEVTLPDGRRYALNVWTFLYLHRARFPWPYDVTDEPPAEYVLPPDLFVERLDRPTLERVVTQLLENDEMKDEWLSPPDNEPPSVE